MASPTQWTWVWASSESWWWTGEPGILQSMGLQRVGHHWATELNWTDTKIFLLAIHLHPSAEFLFGETQLLLVSQTFWSAYCFQKKGITCKAQGTYLQTAKNLLYHLKVCFTPCTWAKSSFKFQTPKYTFPWRILAIHNNKR